MNRGRGRHRRGDGSSPIAWIQRHTGRSGNSPQSDSTELPVEGDGLSTCDTYSSKDGKKKVGQTYVGYSPSDHSGNNSRKIHQWSSCQRNELSNLDRYQQRQHSPGEPGYHQEVKCSAVLSPINEKRASSYSTHSISRGIDMDSVQNKTVLVACMEVLSTEPNSSLPQVEAEGQLLTEVSAKVELFPCNDISNSSGTNASYHKEHPTPTVGFDICPSKDTKTVVLKPSLLVKNRERRNEVKRSMEGQRMIVLRSGMILLKGYLSLSDQIKIVKKCWDLGRGAQGFYQPGYRDGAKLCLKMMCLGKIWDPQTSQYGDHWPIDGSKPPAIPAEFYQLVEKAIRDSHAFIQQNSKTRNPEDTLPWMSPDICLVNFYSENGRLGLHQDRDESKESLDKGLPVVSFSVGDSADFLFGDQRDIEKADKVVLESGDILIFGGRSRHVFHGVTAIHPNTASKHLLEETCLRPGRLNLTFRQY